MIKQLITFVREAGAASESDTERDGFLSYHAEPHAVGVGFGVAFLMFANDQYSLLGVFVGAVSAGLRAESTRQPSRVLGDVRDEPHYALGGFACGAAMGALVRLYA